MRQQSPATQLRHLKSEKAKLTRYIEALSFELKSRRHCGQMMSNLCFNLAQNDEYNATARQNMKDCQKMWDKIEDEVKP